MLGKIVKSMDREWFILLFLGLGLLAVSVIESREVFPNAAVTLALRIIGLLLIVGIVAFWAWQRKRLQNP